MQTYSSAHKLLSLVLICEVNRSTNIRNLNIRGKDQGLPSVGRDGQTRVSVPLLYKFPVLVFVLVLQE